MTADPDEQVVISASPPGRVEVETTSHDIARLIVGGALLGGSILLDWLHRGSSRPQLSETAQYQSNSEREVEDEDTIRLRHAVLGLTFRTVEVARRGTSAVLGAAGLALKPVKAVMISPASTFAAGPFDRLVEKGRAELEGLIQYGAEEEQRSKEVTEKTFNQAVAGVTDYLGDNPQIQGLIRAQVDLLSKQIDQVPQMDVLVQVLVNNYIEYLNEHPEKVEDLLTKQSLSLAGEITEAARLIAVTLDSFSEMIIRRILHRADRSELPEPPPQVMALAVYNGPLGTAILQRKGQQ